MHCAAVSRLLSDCAGELSAACRTGGPLLRPAAIIKCARSSLPALKGLVVQEKPAKPVAPPGKSFQENQTQVHLASQAPIEDETTPLLPACWWDEHRRWSTISVLSPDGIMVQGNPAEIPDCCKAREKVHASLTVTGGRANGDAEMSPAVANCCNEAGPNISIHVTYRHGLDNLQYLRPWQRVTCGKGIARGAEVTSSMASN